jgi:hypothetical protein
MGYSKAAKKSQYAVRRALKPSRVQPKLGEWGSGSSSAKVGDIFYDSWGYDQTNIDYIMVVGVSPSGKTAITKQLGEKVVRQGSLEEDVVPSGVTFGDAYRLHVRGDSLVGSVDGRKGYFYRWDGKPKNQSHYH